MLLQQQAGRLVVYVPSISSIVLIVKFMGECTFSPSGLLMFFYIVARGRNFTSSAYLRENSVNQYYKHIERRHVNREEFCEKKGPPY